MKFLKVLALSLFLVAPAAAFAEVRLLMGEQAGCAWCARWHKEIGPIYPKTEAGRVAPLWLADIRQPLPDGVTLKRPITFTPTFVLLDDGNEVLRLEGYPGEDFFWGLIESALTNQGYMEAAPKS